MEATFILSARSSQSLTLASYSPAILPSASLRSIRREFLGCGHSPWPSGGGYLRSRAKFRKSGRSMIKQPRFVVRASLHSSLILVVAVTTFSAIAIAYFHHNYRRRKSTREVSCSPAPSNADDEITEHGGEIQVSGARGSQSGKSVRINGSLVEKTEDARNNLEAEKAHRLHEHSVMQDNSFLSKPSDTLVVDSLLSSAADSISANEYDAITNAPLPSSALRESGALESVMVGTKTSRLEIERCGQKSGFGLDIPHLRVGIDSVASQHVVDDTHVVVDNVKDSHQLPLEGNERISYNDILTESPMEEIHTFYGASDAVVKSPSLTTLEVACSSAVSPSTDNFTLHETRPEITATKLFERSSHQTTDDVKGEMPVAHCRGGSSHKKKEVRRDGRLLRDKDGGHVVQLADKSTQQIPIQTGVLANNHSHPSEKLNAYNRLLKDGRLGDCIDMLEDMEQKGLLDMDKIHHASFFKTCKNKKAVKEAFRFTKLVPNPTLSTFNMLMSVCASSQDTEGALQVLQLVQETGMRADCKLYTTLISTCAKSGKVDAMFEVFHKMVNSGVEPNVHTYGALIDGCARAGQVAKAFGAYGIMRSKNVKPDRVVFNALITACGQSGVVDRAFDVLAEMGAEAHPINPDHITVGALMKACSKAGQVDRAKEVYKMIHNYDIRGTPAVYTIAVNCCSQTGDWEFACSVYSDMKKKGVAPDEVFFSALIDVAGHAGKLDTAFEILQEAKTQGIRLGIISYSSLMGACCNAKDWQRALELYENIKSIKLKPTVSTMNALITALCEGDQLLKAMEILHEMKALRLTPNTITYSMLMMASERKDDLEASLMLLARAKEDAVAPNLIMCRSITSMCLRRFEKACTIGEPVLSFNSGRPQIENKWTSLALMAYRETILGGIVPTMEVVSQVLGCLKLPPDASLRDRLTENLRVTASSSRHHNLSSLVDGFGEYDPRAFSLLEEATSLGILPTVSFKESPIVVDSRKLHSNTVEVYLLTIFKGLKHRLAAGAKLPNINVLLPIETTQVRTPEGKKKINVAGRISQAIAALLRRLGIPYQGKESNGKIRISGLALRRWLQPKLASPFSGKPGDLKSSQTRLGKQIFHQQRSIRIGNLSLE